MKLIKKIYSFFDKRVIVPVTRLITVIGSKIKKLNKPLEVLLRKKSSTIVIALIVAAIIFVLVDRSNLTMENNAEVLYNQPVTAVYNTEEYVIEGLPKTVDITMIGSRANLYLAKQLSNQVVTVDLSDLGVGTHQVNLKYKQAVSSVEYKLDPSTVSITIFNKQSLSKDITNEEYYHLPIEYAATRWAGDYIQSHADEIARLNQDVTAAMYKFLEAVDYAED